jgi:hypothetical protein
MNSAQVVNWGALRIGFMRYTKSNRKRQNSGNLLHKTPTRIFNLF